MGNAPIVDTKKQRGRPKKSVEENKENQKSLIHSGLSLLTQKGFGVTGLDEITKNAGLPKGSFYAYYASKEVFGLAVLKSYSNYIHKMLDRYLMNESRTPLDRIDDFIVKARMNMVRYNFARGSLIGNIGQEVSTLPDTYRIELTNVIIGWQQKVENCLLDAQKMGEINGNINCAEKADFFWSGLEGAILKAKIERLTGPLDNFKKSFRKSLKN
jgi:TetR/AcrR family transcriptional repressor of nem operon